ncbi:MAG: hydrogenase [Deltaproteobacteria bacterium]|jgi:nitrogenase molybdenum-iron protein beta chain|nr:hydrogenase [Deltaproteobacteria bacterium]
MTDGNIHQFHPQGVLGTGGTFGDKELNPRACELIEKPRATCPLGAQHTVLAIPGGVPIVHAGPGCSSKVASFLNDQAGLQGGGYLGGANVPSSNFSENEVVFGGEAKLRRTIEGSLKVMAGELFVVMTGCTPDIVGDDSEGVAREFRRQGYPVTMVETAGFKGNNYYGHELVNAAIIRDLVPMEKKGTIKGLVNVFCTVPYQDPYWRGDLKATGDLLRKLGLIPNLLYGNQSQGYKAWLKIPKAEFSLVMGPWLDHKTAQLIKDNWDVPVFHYKAPPIGAVETTRFLRAIGDFASISSKKLEKIIATEEAIYYDYLISAADYLTESRNGLPSRFEIIAPSGAALSHTLFWVNDLGFSPGKVVISDNPPEEYRGQIDKYFSLLDGDEVVPIYEEDGGLAARIIESDLEKDPEALVLASSWERDLANRTGSFLMRVSVPIYDRLIMNKSYWGYAGGLYLLEDLHAEILNKSA